VIGLTTTPYSLAWGSHVFAKVAAINVYGISAISSEGNGAKIITYPDAPILLAEDYTKRTPTGLTLTWANGVANGGSDIIDYQVSYDEASGTDFVIFESNILTSDFLVSKLVSGATYQFKVQARNSFGLSAYSLPITLTIGFKPE